MKLYAPLALALCLTTSLAAQTAFTDPANLRGERVTPLDGHELPIDQSTSGLQQLLRKLNTRASLMLIVAHPDDEDGGMLTLYSRGHGARVADLALNRGEGGQNAMTGDFEDALGLIRTQELLSADRYFNATQFFGTEVDFGFSKTKEEAFSKWTHQRVLYDVVRAIRLYRPLVIASVFIGGVTDGHGQHQVAGEIAQEAFVAAADPNVFPELTAEGILPWAPLKMYARVPRQAVTAQGLFDYATGQYAPARFTNYVTGAVTTTLPSADVVIHEGTPDPLLTFAGANPADLRSNAALRDESTSNHSATNARSLAPLSYVQFARIGLGLQRSQIGPGMRLPPPGAFDIAYHLYGSRLCNAPVDARLPDSPNSHNDALMTPAPNKAVILSEVKDPCISPAAALPSNPSTPTASPAPTARFIPAQGDALGSGQNESPRAGGPPDSSALATQPSFFDGIDTSIEGIATLAPDAQEAVPLLLKTNLKGIAQKIKSAQQSASAGHLDYATNELATALKLVDMLIKDLDEVKPEVLPVDQKQNVFHELGVKRAQLNDALDLSLGLSLDALSSQVDIISNSNASITETVREQSKLFLGDIKCGLRNSRFATVDAPAISHEDSNALAAGHVLHRLIQGETALNGFVTRPYFSRSDIEQPVYMLRDADLRNAATSPPALTASCSLNYQGTDFTISRIVRSGPQPVQIIPPASVSWVSPAQILPHDQSSLLASLTVQPAGVRVEADLPEGWKVAPDIEPLHSAPGFKQLRLEPSKPPSQPVSITAIAMPRGGPEVREGFRPVGYPGLITTNYYTPATDRIVPVDLKLPPANHRRIAYLPGTGDAVPEALASIGLTPTILTVADLTPDKLKAYDTVILGVRTYNAHPDLHGAPTQALLDYANTGGNVLVQYQTYEFTAADAPYPLTLGNAEKVVDETDPVKLLDPQSPLLATPNRITPADFNSWIEERGHGFLRTWDPRYTALTETHDPGGPETAPQAPQLGGLITTPLGKGRWTYCAFALYRQLPEAVPGAYRLFVNLLNP